MVQKYITESGIIHALDDYMEGAWVQMTEPTFEECEEVAHRFDIDIADIRAALDDEESARISIEDNYTLILADIPTIERKQEHEIYSTMPLGIILTKDTIITVCAEKTVVLDYFTNRFSRDFSTKKRMRFVYQILYRSCMCYQGYLRIINRRRTEIEERISVDTKDSDLIELHDLESNLVYFATSLRTNGVVLDRLTRYERIMQFPEDRELLEDVIIENRQAIEMTQIYRDIINGTRELMSTVINNRLNNVMKYLTSITIVMAIPTIISGLYGMNVNEKGMPFASLTGGFAIICALTLIICIITLLILRKSKML
jgi:magnesium transporter